MAFTAKVITTAAWGARPVGTTFTRTVPRYIVVHHTDNQNPPSDPSQRTIEGSIRFAQGIQKLHMNENGWSDSGHNFLNTTGGFILEGRHGSLDAVKAGFCVQSAHALQDLGKLSDGNKSPGIENEGNFMTFQMGQKQWDSLVELCASLCDSCNISPANIRGHREFSDTDCPGDWLFEQLPRLRNEVADKLSLFIDPDELDNLDTTTILRFGSIGPAVLKLQQKLKDKRFNPGPLDGIFGDGTRSAVIMFQRSIGLADDGEVGPLTKQALGL
jgi:hypothetical protein